MDKAMGIVMTVVAVAVMLIVFPIILDASEELRAGTETQTFAAAATGADETSATVNLTYDLWRDSSSNVKSITSDNPSDTPVAGTYTAGTKSLTVTGLAANSTRNLTVAYQVGRLGDYTGLDSIVSLAPLLLIIGMLGAILGGTYLAWKAR